MHSKTENRDYFLVSNEKWNSWKKVRFISGFILNFSKFYDVPRHARFSTKTILLVLCNSFWCGIASWSIVSAGSFGSVSCFFNVYIIPWSLSSSSSSFSLPDIWTGVKVIIYRSCYQVPHYSLSSYKYKSPFSSYYSLHFFHAIFYRYVRLILLAYLCTNFPFVFFSLFFIGFIWSLRFVI